MGLTRPCNSLIIRVAVGAMRLLAVNVRDGIGVLQLVFFHGKTLKVLGVYASPVPACVVDDVAIWYLAVGAIPSNAVCAPTSASEVKRSVPVSI